MVTEQILVQGTGIPKVGEYLNGEVIVDVIVGDYHDEPSNEDLMHVFIETERVCTCGSGEAVSHCGANTQYCG